MCFAPHVHQDGSFTQHGAVQPPPHPISRGYDVPPTPGQQANPGQNRVGNPSTRGQITNERGLSHGSMIPFANNVPIQSNPRPCFPPYGPCPGPIPPNHNESYNGSNNMHSDNLYLPLSHSAQQGLPLSETYQNEVYPQFRFFPPSPPGYNPITNSSPPDYKPLPSPNEGTLLLASPPSFQASTCPYLSSSIDPLDLPTHTCPHCLSHTNNQSRHKEKLDWVIALLVILNIFVWGLVGYGYWQQFTGDSVDIGSWFTSYLGGQGASGWGQICRGEDCRWAFVDC
ncbi:uncharacterized protein L201_001380 [Kwoniella dendrophila CBS 6074]|uniref:LITAF domain-containing protein n=1 Tax=Kwoniella dendrophila CBS 6074 TaxID=1295534 RepID=A0AAX4JPW6_9TREE